MDGGDEEIDGDFENLLRLEHDEMLAKSLNMFEEQGIEHGFDFLQSSERPDVEMEDEEDDDEAGEHEKEGNAGQGDESITCRPSRRAPTPAAPTCWYQTWDEYVLHGCSSASVLPLQKVQYSVGCI